jgi:uncharacterized protein (TIGR00297 family)
VVEWRKAIPESRDKLQSRLLVWTAGSLLILSMSFALLRPAVPLILAGILGMPRRYHAYPNQQWLWIAPWIVSLTFGLLVWAVRAATLGGVFFGSAICLLVTLATERASIWHSALPALLTLFLLTFAATRAGKHQKVRLGVAEDRHGRSAAQVIANLGIAGLLPLAAYFRAFDWNDGISREISFSEYVLPVLLIAALCEATADTVSSEIGQAFGGTPFLLTTFRRVAPGTDGAISLIGTAAGIAGAAVVALVAMLTMNVRSLTFPPRFALISFAGGVAGLLFDSLLGATVERKGWLGNDLVNFSSTAFAVLVALAPPIAFQLVSLAR